MNVAIIGSNGFIGYHLTERLSKIPNINLFLFGRGKTSVFENAKSYAQIDLLNQEQIKSQFSDIDIVYYLVSATIPATSWENPSIELEKNLLPFITFTECIAKLNVKKIIFVSSAGTVYGSSSQKVMEDSDKKPFSPYGIIKLTIEYFLNYFKAKYNINFDVYRISNVYGEGQDTSKGLGIINTFIENILQNQQIKIFGNGQSTRNYVYVKDVAELLTYSVTSDLNESNVFNIASDDTKTINDLLLILKKVLVEDFQVIYADKRLSDNSIIDLDNTKILKQMPTFKYTEIETGIKQTYYHIKKKNYTNSSKNE